MRVGRCSTDGRAIRTQLLAFRHVELAWLVLYGLKKVVFATNMGRRFN